MRKRKTDHTQHTLHKNFSWGEVSEISVWEGQVTYATPFMKKYSDWQT